MKMWSGRFETDTDASANAFNSSLHFDKKLVFYDIAGSIAHVNMLRKQQIIPNEDADRCIAALEELRGELERGEYEISGEYEDIHMAVEEILTERIGTSAKMIHTARSRNDQVALDMKMFVLDSADVISSKLKKMIGVLKDTALGHLDTIMPGYTHMQRAQPVSLAHHFCAYIEMFMRDLSRLNDCAERMNTMPLGSGALACSTFGIDRDFVSASLGFAAPTKNSLDSVSDRDYIIELSCALSVIMMHLSRFCEEIIIWSTDEFGFVTLSDAFSTGSSMMPQKKNPDMAELIRGKTGRVYGSLMGLLTVMKGLPLAYNKDMQEDKEMTFDALDTVSDCLDIFAAMIGTAVFSRQNMLSAAVSSFINATDLAEYLVKKGTPFRDAHFAVGALVKKCISENRYLHDLTLGELREFSDAFEDDYTDVLDVSRSAEMKEMTGSPNSRIVKEYLDSIVFE